MSRQRRRLRRRLRPGAPGLVGLLALALAALVTADARALAPDPPLPTPFRFGLNAGGLDPVASAEPMGRLGVAFARVEFPIGARVPSMRRTFAAHARQGVRILPLAGFHGRIPTRSQARNLARWAREFGPGGRFWATRRDGHLAIRAIEFGNETSYRHQGVEDRGGDYARRLRDAYRAIHRRRGNDRVGLLAQADDGGTKTSEWVDAMFDAVPELAALVSGWTVHPYGPRERAHPRIDRLVAQTAARGAAESIPIHVTEWGVTTDGGRCLTDNYEWTRCMTYRHAADALRDSVAGLRARYGSRLAAFYLYQVTDQERPGVTREREAYFGAFQRDGSVKGAYTREIRGQLRRHAPAR